MIPEVGAFSLILALCLSMMLATLPIIGAYQNNFLWMSMARPLSAGVFQASRVLAKHDENFMSPEVKAALDAAGASTDNYMPGGRIR